MKKYNLKVKIELYSIILKYFLLIYFDGIINNYIVYCFFKFLIILTQIINCLNDFSFLFK